MGERYPSTRPTPHAPPCAMAARGVAAWSVWSVSWVGGVHCLGGWSTLGVGLHGLVVLGGEVGVEVVELAATVLEARGRLGGVGARHVLGDPLPQQSDQRVHDAPRGAGGCIARRLPGQRLPAPGRWAESMLASGCAASQRTPMRRITAPHSGQVAVEWLTGVEGERCLRTSTPRRASYRRAGSGPGPAAHVCQPRLPKVAASASFRYPRRAAAWVVAWNLVAGPAPAAGGLNGGGLVPGVTRVVPGTVDRCGTRSRPWDARPSHACAPNAGEGVACAPADQGVEIWPIWGCSDGPFGLMSGAHEVTRDFDRASPGPRGVGLVDVPDTTCPFVGVCLFLGGRCNPWGM